MAYVPLVNLVPQFFDNLGDPLVGGTLSAYVAGTSTPTNMFSDNAGTVAGTSVTLDSRGEPTTIKLIWIDTTISYKFILRDSTGTTIWTEDNITPQSVNDGSITTAKLANLSVTTAKLANDSVTTAKIVDDSVTAAKLVDDSVTAAKLANDSVTTANIVDSNVTPAKLSQPMTRATAVSVTNQPVIEFTGLPSWVKKITICIEDVQVANTAISIVFQIGTSAGFETTNYFAIGAAIPTGTASNIAYGFPVTRGSSLTTTYNGCLQLTNMTGNYWVAMGMFANIPPDSALMTFISGYKETAATLDRIRLTTSNGQNFVTATANIIYEG